MASCLAGPEVHADVAAPRFSDHMVLQRDMAVPVFGTAAAGEAITVSFHGQTKTAKTGSDGKWQVRLDNMPAGGPFTLEIKGANTIKIQDVLVGEVWIFSGQSNMEMPMNMWGSAELYPDSVAKANYPNIRFVLDSKAYKWEECTPASVEGFSAVGFFFGQEIHRKLNVPVGLIKASLGGTWIERWMGPNSLVQGTDNDLYKTYVEHMVPMAIRGVTWYQGENSIGNTQYTSLLISMISGWRKAWGQGDFPFYIVQLPNYQTQQTLQSLDSPVQNSGWAAMRESQRLALTSPNTALAVTIDVGDANDLHPRNKYPVGYRLALPARALVYGETNLVYSGPMYESMRTAGGKAYLRLRHAGGGLMAKGGGSLKGFAIAGSDNKWVWAETEIRKDTVVAWSNQVPNPVSVRYAWADNPICNLYNAEGLPASPFKTDGAQLPVASVGGRIRPAQGLHDYPFAVDGAGRKTANQKSQDVKRPEAQIIRFHPAK